MSARPPGTRGLANIYSLARGGSIQRLCSTQDEPGNQFDWVVGSYHTEACTFEGGVAQGTVRAANGRLGRGNCPSRHASRHAR